MQRNVRRRIEDTAAPAANPNRRRAIAIAAKLNKKFPYAQFGRAYVRRGSAESLTQFGPTYREANAAQKDSRKRYGYIGRGLYNAQNLRSDYETLMGKRLSRAISGKLSSAVRNFPMPFSGSGMYTNNLISGGQGSVPSMMGSGDETGSVTVTHQEYISDIFGPGVKNGTSVPFENSAYPLNPGMEKTFPWLSQIASNFEEYEFKQLLFHYTSTISDGNNQNGQCGTLTMATDYNAAHEPFSDKQEMLGYAHSYSCKTTESMDHGVECDPQKNAMSKVLYVRSGGLTTSEDIKTYDHGLFQLAISNIPTGYQGEQLGELRVSYTVTLRKPKLYTARGLSIQRDLFVTDTGTGNRLIDTTTKVYTGQANSIGVTLVRGQAVGGNTGTWFYLPDYYTGALKITCIARSLQVVAGNTMVVYDIDPVINTGYLNGNVQMIKDLYSTEGEPSGSCVTTVPVGAAADTDAVSIFCIFVRASSNGINNGFFLHGHPGMTSQCQLMVLIEEYNSLDKSTFSQVSNLVSPSGVVVAGNATL